MAAGARVGRMRDRKPRSILGPWFQAIGAGLALYQIGDWWDFRVTWIGIGVCLVVIGVGMDAEAGEKE